MHLPGRSGTSRWLLSLCIALHASALGCMQQSSKVCILIRRLKASVVACSCYSLFLGFARSPVNFHAQDGSGYKFMGDAILKVR